MGMALAAWRHIPGAWGCRPDGTTVAWQSKVCAWWRVKPRRIACKKACRRAGSKRCFDAGEISPSTGGAYRRKALRQVSVINKAERVLWTPTERRSLERSRASSWREFGSNGEVTCAAALCELTRKISDDDGWRNGKVVGRSRRSRKTTQQ